MIYDVNEVKYYYLISGNYGDAPSLNDNGSNACYFAFVPLVEGADYTVTVTASDVRLRVATYSEIPTSASAVGIRHVANSMENPSVGTSFTFTAQANENYMVYYGGASDNGATGNGKLSVEYHIQTHAYDTLLELINAETLNMTCLINNIAYDDNYFVISNAPSWLKFNGLTASTITASGNSWLGINSATEHIRFNRRDCKMFYLWTETGTLFNYFQFYKIRWRGYSHYNSANWQEWEVIFFDNGDFMIRTIAIPGAYWNGQFNVVTTQTYTYNPPTMASPYISFYHLDNEGKNFRMAYELLDIHYPSRWLIEDESVYYTISDGELSPVPISEISAENMETYGFIGEIDGVLIKDLVSPTVYGWNDETAPQPTVSAKVTAIPFTQEMKCISDMSDETISGITSVTADYSGDVTIRYSLDHGTTYTEDMSIADFILLDFEELFENLPADKKLYLIFTFNEGDILTNLTFNFY